MVKLREKYKDEKVYILACDAEDRDYVKFTLDSAEGFDSFLEVESYHVVGQGIKGLIGYEGRWTCPLDWISPKNWSFNLWHCRISCALAALFGVPIPGGQAVLVKEDAEEMIEFLNQWINEDENNES